MGCGRRILVILLIGRIWNVRKVKQLHRLRKYAERQENRWAGKKKRIFKGRDL